MCIYFQIDMSYVASLSYKHYLSSLDYYSKSSRSALIHPLSLFSSEATIGRKKLTQILQFLLIVTLLDFTLVLLQRVTRPSVILNQDTPGLRSVKFISISLNLLQPKSLFAEVSPALLLGHILQYSLSLKINTKLHLFPYKNQVGRPF